MINLPVKIIDIRSVDPMIMISKNTASRLNLKHTDIVSIKGDISELVAYPVVVQGMIADNIVGISERDAKWLKVVDGSIVSISSRKKPQSYEYIKNKMKGKKWTDNEIISIVSDISKRRMTQLEISTFALVSQFQGFTNNEMITMAKTMAEEGTQFNFDEPVYDKHSIGGTPGNKVTPIIVSIVAAAGLLIPKTSSRAITSPAGTADTMEVMCDVAFNPDEISEIAPKSRGMVVWNAPLNLSPLDSIVVDVKKELGIDPRDQMLASIVSTKIAMGVDKLVFDIPTGVGTKMPDRNEAIEFAHSIIGLSRKFNITTQAAVTLGDQPLGNNIGPALEAKEALLTLEGKGPNSVIEKSVELAGILLEMGGVAQRGKGSEVATEYINSGKAYKKFQEIVEYQGGEKDISSDKIEIGEYKATIKAVTDGYIQGISNKGISEVARQAGCPKHKKAGITIHVKKGTFVHEGDPLFTIYSTSEGKLSNAIQTATSMPPFNIEGIILNRIGSISEP